MFDIIENKRKTIYEHIIDNDMDRKQDNLVDQPENLSILMISAML